MESTRILAHLPLLALCLGGLLSLALSLVPLPPRGDDRRAALWLAEIIVSVLFLLFVAALCTGTFGLLRAWPMALLGAAAGAASLKRTLIRLPCAREAMAAALHGGTQPAASRLALACILFTIFTGLATTMPAGDFLSYHLLNIRNFTDDGSTVTVDPAIRPLGAPHHYTRGMEAILSVFFLDGLPREGTFLFGLLGIVLLLLALRTVAEGRSRADVVFSLLVTTLAVQENIREIKNDLMIGVLMLLAAAPLLSRRHNLRLEWLPMAACTGLLLALKGNGAIYAVIALGAWTLASPRPRWTKLFRVLAVALPAGGYFYAVNWLTTGNPVYPFAFTVLGVEIFPGREIALAATTLLANVDPALPVYLLRGALRALGPVGIVALGSATLACVGLLRDRLRRRPLAPSGADGAAAIDGAEADSPAVGVPRTPDPLPPEEGLDARHPTVSSAPPPLHGRDSPEAGRRGWLLPAVFAATLAAWVATPYSDNTSLEVHSSLYSGHSLRFGFPLLFLIAAAAAARGGRPTRRAAAVAGAGCIVNLFAYDLTALVIKPGNAFAWLSPVIRSFDNGLLLATAAAIVVLSAAIARRPRHAAVAMWVLTAALLFHIGWPGSLSWALQFKQIGETTRAFDLLEEMGGASRTISASRVTGGTLATGIDYLLPERFDRVNRVKDPARPPPADIYLYAAEASVAIDDLVKGRQTSVGWRYMEAITPPAGTEPILEDRFFRIYARRPARAGP